MNSTVKYMVVLLLTTAFLVVATVLVLPRLRTSPEHISPSQNVGMTDVGKDDPEADSSAKISRSTQTSGKNAKSLAERNKAKFDIGEMRNEAEDWIQRFRGTPEERREITRKIKDDTALILLLADAAESSVEGMTHDELVRERADFEKDYRALLDYLKTGKLQRMLKTQEEQEVIGTAFEAAQSFLERLDAALNSQGY